MNLGHARRDDPLLDEVALVADEQLADGLLGVSLDLLQPLLHVVERLLQEPTHLGMTKAGEPCP